MLHLRRALDQFRADTRFALRNLTKSPAFTAITISSLALGIGGTTAMYSVIYGVVLHPFIYKDVDRLASVQIVDNGGRSNFSYYSIDQFLDIAESNTIFSGVIASTWSDVTWMNGAEPERIRGNHCTSNTFEVMGVPALLGRTTSARDASISSEPPVILGYKFWQRSFGGDRTVIGRKLRLNDKIRTVIGVMPKRFMWRGADVYLPDVLRRGQSLEGDTDVALLGRLKTGITPGQAETALMPLLRQVQQRNPEMFPERWRLRLRTFSETFPSGITEALWILFGACGLLLLIACVNVSNLLVSHLVERRREIAVRSALGASRARLLSQLLSETAALAAGGGVFGAALAWLGLKGVLAMVPPNTIPDEAEVTLNTGVLCFTLGVSVVTALLIGALPGFMFSGANLTSALREEGRSATASTRQRWIRSVLVAGEVALSLVLLSAASLMVRTLLRLQAPDLGIQPNRILTARVPLNKNSYKTVEQRNAFFEQVIQRIAAVPGVSAVGLNSGLPPIGNFHLRVETEGAGRADRRNVMLHQTNADYSRALGLSVVSGRFLSEVDVRARIHGAVINQAFARRYFGNGEALGKILHIPDVKRAPTNLKDDAFEIIGVVKDAVNDLSTQAREPELYIPFTLLPFADRLYVAGSVPPEALERAVRQQIYSVQTMQPVTDVRALSGMLEEYVYAGPKFNLLMFGIFAGLGLIMALLGVYGVIATGVAQRTREIGIRLALGAQPLQVIGMVLLSSVKVLAVGTLFGLAGSIASARLLANIVHDVSTVDAFSLAAVVLLLLGTGIAASVAPARRASRIDPLEALRES